MAFQFTPFVSKYPVYRDIESSATKTMISEIKLIPSIKNVTIGEVSNGEQIIVVEWKNPIQNPVIFGVQIEKVNAVIKRNAEFIKTDTKDTEPEIDEFMSHVSVAINDFTKNVTHKELEDIRLILLKTDGIVCVRTRSSNTELTNLQTAERVGVEGPTIDIYYKPGENEKISKPIGMRDFIEEVILNVVNQDKCESAGYGNDSPLTEE